MKTNKSFFVNCLISFLFVVACGGNNGQVGNPDAGTDGGQPLCANVNCDDKVACTRDSCNEATGECRHQADHALCAAGTVCMPKEGCKSPPPCATDADCPDTDNGPCMQEYCEPASSTCRWNPLDKDGDGYAPQICADIGGDDCDDDDYSRHPGVEEECNGADENCNGILDDMACPEGQSCDAQTGRCTDILTCRQWMDCRDACSTQECLMDCNDRASAQAQQQYEDWMQCYGANCGKGGGCKQNCEDEFVVCGLAPTGVCADLKWCGMDCTDNDCFNNCYTSAPVDCQQCYNQALTQARQCRRQICPNEYDAFMNCATQNCGQLPENGLWSENQQQCIEQNCGQQSYALDQCLYNLDATFRLKVCNDLFDPCFFEES